MTVIEEKKMSLVDHLNELRRRLFLAVFGPLLGFIICYAFLRKYLMAIILLPPYPDWHLFGYHFFIDPVPVKFNFSTPYSQFMTILLISFIGGCIISAPWVFYHLWAFISAGLKQKERKYVVRYGLFSLVLFGSGAAFFYFLVYPMSIHFLYGFSADFNTFVAASRGTEAVSFVPDQFHKAQAVAEATNFTLVDSYVSFVLMMMLIFGLMFEVPLVVLFLGKTNLVKLETFRRYRRHIIMVLVVIAAIVTPPDIFSQIALTIPMWLLYEFGVLLVSISKRRQQLAEPAPADDVDQDAGQDA